MIPVFLNPKSLMLTFDEFVKSRIHQVFGVSCLVFGMKYMMLYRPVRVLNTKYQIQNTLVKSLLFRLFTRPSTFGFKFYLIYA